ncbi:MAG: hypothetical protein WC838_07270 [Candidatus Margulisiibacteriota bacterium]|jgi:hypothetical protein
MGYSYIHSIGRDFLSAKLIKAPVGKTTVLSVAAPRPPQEHIPPLFIADQAIPPVRWPEVTACDPLATLNDLPDFNSAVKTYLQADISDAEKLLEQIKTMPEAKGLIKGLNKLLAKAKGTYWSSLTLTDIKGIFPENRDLQRLAERLLIEPMDLSSSKGKEHILLAFKNLTQKLEDGRWETTYYIDQGDKQKFLAHLKNYVKVFGSG